MSASIELHNLLTLFMTTLSESSFSKTTTAGCIKRIQKQFYVLTLILYCVLIALFCFMIAIFEGYMKKHSNINSVHAWIAVLLLSTPSFAKLLIDHLNYNDVSHFLIVFQSLLQPCSTGRLNDLIVSNMWHSFMETTSTATSKLKVTFHKISLSW